MSPYLAGEARTGDKFELRGPIGGYFVWTPDLGGPLFLVAGGSGVVPLMAMLRQRAAANGTVPATLLYSSRSFDDIIYRAELERLVGQDDGLKVVHTLTRERPAGWRGLSRRIDRAMLESVGFAPAAQPAHFRLRADAAGRGRRAQPSRHRPRAASDQDRTFRTDGNLGDRDHGQQSPSTAMRPAGACANCLRST